MNAVIIQLLIHSKFCKYTGTVVVFYKKYQNTIVFVNYNCKLQIFLKIIF